MAHRRLCLECAFVTSSVTQNHELRMTFDGRLLSGVSMLAAVSRLDRDGRGLDWIPSQLHLLCRKHNGSASGLEPSGAPISGAPPRHYVAFFPLALQTSRRFCPPSRVPLAEPGVTGPIALT
jgi:hypothetical protein